jgi:hypothetical protein
MEGSCTCVGTVASHLQCIVFPAGNISRLNYFVESSPLELRIKPRGIQASQTPLEGWTDLTHFEKVLHQAQDDYLQVKPKAHLPEVR